MFFLKEFQVKEIYFYNLRTERLCLSSGRLARLLIFDNAFSNTQLCLSYAGHNGYCVEEFVYDDGILIEIRTSHGRTNLDKKVEIHRFAYESRNLIQIERICQNGYKELLYTTKTPDFSKIKENTYKDLRDMIVNYNGNFASFGIEGFIDQQQPMFCICFSEDKQPSDLIADWDTEMFEFRVYDWRLSGTQEKKAVKMIAEIIIDLVNEGLLKDKNFYFHQNQICVTRLYPGVKGILKEAKISVR